MTFDSLGLSPTLLRAVADKGYETPSPIQAQAIPAIIAGKDVMAAAQPKRSRRGQKANDPSKV